MKINHRFAGGGDEPVWAALGRRGVAYDAGPISVLNITEDHPQWPIVKRLFAEHGGAIEQIGNRFTKEEMDAAEWLRAFSLGHHGHPQPEEDFGFREWTYDLCDACTTCGIGMIQKAPFRFRTAPKAKRSQFIQLNRVFDELFIRLPAQAGLIEAGITGITFEAPVLHQSDRPLADVSQVRIATVLPPALDVADLTTVICKPDNEEGRKLSDLSRPAPATSPYCGRVKYHAPHRGPLRFASSAFDGAPEVVKSQEWFGSGRSAHRLILVTQRFRQTVVSNCFRGLAFEPVELAPA